MTPRSALAAGKTGVYAAIGAFAVCAAFLLMAGKNPFEATSVMILGALGSLDGVYEVLTRSVPLALMGLGIAVAFRANIYNIGADGQFLIGALVATAASLALGDIGVLSLPWLLLAGAVGGGLYGAVAGWLRARFDANEIIVTIMLNYVALQVLGWVVRGPMQETVKIIPRSNPIPDSAFLPEIAMGQTHGGVVIALVLALILYAVLRYGTFGFRIDAVGENRAAAEYGGIAAGRVIVAATAVSGAVCGLAGAVEVGGVFHRLEDNMGQGAGATAIAVALLARLNPLYVPLTALLFGVLTVGAGALQRQMGVPFPLLWIIEAAVIFAFLLAGVRRARTA